MFCFEPGNRRFLPLINKLGFNTFLTVDKIVDNLLRKCPDINEATMCCAGPLTSDLINQDNVAFQEQKSSTFEVNAILFFAKFTSKYMFNYLINL